MSNGFDTCPHCGQSILKGAMRCTRCGNIIKTPEEQLSSIQKLSESEKPGGSNIGTIFKFIFLLLVIGAIYYFSDQIIGFVRGIL